MYLCAIAIIILIFQVNFAIIQINVINIIDILNALIICIRSVFFKRIVWKKWLKLLQNTNLLLISELGESLESGWTNINFFIFYVLNFGILGLLASYILLEAYRYYHYIITCILISAEYLSGVILFTLRKGFKIVNIYSISLNYENGLHLDIIAKLNEHKTVYCRKLYANLYQISIYSNDLFHLVYTTLFLRLIASTCYILYLLIHEILYETTDPKHHLSYIIYMLNRLVSENFDNIFHIYSLELYGGFK